jgi:GT2 family glycosyltransferase
MKHLIGILTLNRQAYLEACLNSISEAIAHRRNDFLVVASDDGSSDGTDNWLEQTALSTKLVDRILIRNGRGGVARNSNRLIQEFLKLGNEAGLLFLLNDDILVSPKVFDVYEEAFEKTGYHHFCYSDRHLDVPAIALSKNGVGLVKRLQGEGAFMAFSKHAIEVLGGFDVTYGLFGGEHVAVSDRAAKAGLADGVLDVAAAERLVYIRQHYEKVPCSIAKKYDHIHHARQIWIEQNSGDIEIYKEIEA